VAASSAGSHACRSCSKSRGQAQVEVGDITYANATSTSAASSLSRVRTPSTCFTYLCRW
jgi:hypothetical protein